ncbi:MAG: hypothetical protein OQL20_02990, partial [Sedimenticola sp.]|nr:hypothetical protein [Sedimenticola sp.]
GWHCSSGCRPYALLLGEFRGSSTQIPYPFTVVIISPVYLDKLSRHLRIYRPLCWFYLTQLLLLAVTFCRNFQLVIHSLPDVRPLLAATAGQDASTGMVFALQVGHSAYYKGDLSCFKSLMEILMKLCLLNF